MVFSYSDSGATLKSSDQEAGKPFWKNRVQHLFFFLGYCVNLRTFSSFIYEDSVKNPDHVPSFIQTILVCAVIGGPLLFIQLFIGQFTQKGCIAIGSMVPALYGFGYCMMIVAIFDCALNLYFSGGSMLYMFMSILNFPYPPWMYCTDKMYELFPNCFSRKDIDLCKSCAKGGSQPCFTSSQIFSASLFRFLVAFETDTNIKDQKEISPPTVKSVIHIFAIIFFIYVISCRKLKSLDLSLRISLIFCLLGITVTAVVPLSHKDIWTAIFKLGSWDFESLGDFKTWFAAFRRVTEALKISSGGHVFLGSYMKPDTASHFETLYLIGYYILFIVLFYIHYYLMEIHLKCILNVKNFGIKTANEISFVMLPTELGLTATPQLWCTLHFTVYWLLSIVSTVLQVVLVDEALSEEFKIGQYYIYTRCAICSVIFLICLLLTTKFGEFIAQALIQEMKIINLLVIILIFIIIFLYNIQRLKDDIYFVLNSPPTWYIQACWILTAFITGSTLFLQIWEHESHSTFFTMRIGIYLIVGLPILLGFTVKLIQYVKKQNITGIFRSSLYYGAPDLNTRLMRLLYNPRLEVRYRRRKELCKHRCLLNNEIVLRAIAKELHLLQQVAYDLSRNDEDRIEYGDIIAQLNEHHRIMHIRFAMLVRHAEPHAKLYS